MINKNFYPTPDKVATELWEFGQTLAQLDRSGTILEPSAGKGDLIDSLQAERVRPAMSSRDPIRFRYWTGAIHAIESEETLRSVLKDKQCEVVGDDFLKWSPPEGVRYEAVVMNPPFSEAVHHVLKAWEMPCKYVLVIYPTSHLSHTTKAQRLLNKIVSEHGSRSDRGGVFVDAERATSVEISFLFLKKPQEKNQTDFSDSGICTDQDEFSFDHFAEASEVARFDFIENLVAGYQQVLDEGKKFYAAFSRVVGVGGTFIDTNRAILSAIDPNRGYSSNSLTEQAEAFKKHVQEQAWTTLLDRSRMSRFMTSTIRDEFASFRKEQNGVEFNEENIYACIEYLLLMRGKIMQEGMLTLFDRITRYHEKNSVYYEGWKSNEAYKISRKIVHPRLVTYENRWGGAFSLDWKTKQGFLRDLDVVMCYLDGTTLEEINQLGVALESKIKSMGRTGYGPVQDNEVESTYFRARFFKKGTAHITFLDEKLLSDLNTTVGRLRNWLPGDFDTGSKKPDSGSELTLFRK